jgi:hypothetical protein
MNGRHYVSLHAFRRDAQGVDFCDLRLELESAPGGKSKVMLAYIQPTAGCAAAEKK